jgi:Uma2 family endonuclease
MLTGAAVPVEEYLRTSYEPDMEYVDGQLVKRGVGEHRHSYLQGLLMLVLGVRGKERGFEAYPEHRIVIDPGRRYRIPGVCVKAVPYDPTPVLERPDPVIEILSPDNTLTEAAEKCAEYFRAGIPGIRVADPYRKRSIRTARTGFAWLTRRTWRMN